MDADQPTETTGNARTIHGLAVKLAALSQNGLEFARDVYDVDRYEQVGAIATELLSLLSGHDGDDIRHAMALEGGYATPKVDVRGALFDDQERILLMRERSDGLWSLPGGWADPGDSPACAVEREMLEESGHVVTAVKLVACMDREVQGHQPPLPVHVYKLLFLCEESGAAQAAQERETLDVGWFALDQLPPLSVSRIMEHQLHLALDHQRDRSLATQFD